MADGFIVRKGGVSDATPGPTISFVSKTENSVTFTITNNSLKARDITYGLTTPPTTTTINLAAGATSSNQTISSITEAFVTIFAQAEDSAITEFRVRLDFPVIYTAATGGTTLEYDSGGKRYKSHTFLEDGNFVVTTVGDATYAGLTVDRNKVDYLIVAGGGGGGKQQGGGGGAGGYKTTNGTSGGPSPTTESKVVVTAQSYSIDIGAGGNAGTDSASFSGDNSSALGVTTLGGGGGGGWTGSAVIAAQNGGSGGGQGLSTGSPGSGTSGQGFGGGTNFSGNASGGGGGASEVGKNATGTFRGGNGGNGLANNLRTGSNETRAGGGGGGVFNTSGFVVGTGGAGGGGNGGASTVGQDGTANTGGGGGGGGQNPLSFDGGQGGAGIVVIRYEIAPSV